MAEYFGWVEILRREVQFLDLGGVEENRKFVESINNISKIFSTDKIKTDGKIQDPFRIFRGEQRAIGEVMIAPLSSNDNSPLRGSPLRECIDYATFISKQKDPGFRRWFEKSRKDIELLATEKGRHEQRLKFLQHLLIYLIDVLDQERTRFPKDRDKIKLDAEEEKKFEELIGTGKKQQTKILLTGATGFIGERVLRALSEKNLKVRCLVRRPMHSENPNISYVIGDVLDYDSLIRAAEGVDTVYYFIHMMGHQKAQKRFDILDRLAITNMVRACRTNGVGRIIHLTGIRAPQEKLSTHLESRKEVEEIIKNSGMDYTVFRASVIIGRGGAAFEILDAAVKKLPIIPVFNWENKKAQPIYIGDVIRYLVECIDKKETINRCYDIGCSQVFTYRELMQRYSRELGLKRVFISIPGSWNWLSSVILGKLAPVNPNVIYWLIESLHNNMVCEPDDLKTIFGFEPLSFKESIRKIVETGNHV